MSAHTEGQRRVGMSKNVRAPPLLKSLNRHKTASLDKPHPRGIIQEPDDIEAPPISSDEEDEEPVKPVSAKIKKTEPLWSSDLEEDDSPPRGDIQPSQFKRTAVNKTFGQRESGYSGSRAFREKFMAKRAAASSKSGRNAESDDDLNPTLLESSLLRNKDKTYRVASKRMRSPPPKERLRKKTKKVQAVEEDEMVLPDLKIPEDFPDFETNKSKGRGDSLKIPKGPLDSPSPTALPTRTLRALSASPSHSDVGVPATLDSKFLDTPLKERKGKSLKKPEKTASPPEALRLFNVDEVKTSRAYTGPALDSDDSSLSDLDVSDSEEEDKDRSVQCPYCKKPVSRELFESFSKGSRMSIRQQRTFCSEHKKAEARDLWKTRGYPDIDWDGLDSRIAEHYGFLEKILKGGRSHFGDVLARDVKDGKKRNLMKADFNCSPGYYGTRGFRTMQEAIFARFSKLLRKRAVEDSLVSSRGYSIYVQVVLVPELAVRLVMDDMDVEAEAARRILEESAAIGELLCEDVGDVVGEDDENLF
ncbi:hypothetical protein jhhlp_007090 [Lomentospora prolificans]|uniref:Restriction of telomere capping protein 4 n=1 Tax=Lomentospora prolificans TaxID=41688 RepID=A0A2N3N1Q5_9PEZI|nr:hypothetical protein jhhlp_007090 [Lomentospora prolificans]